MTLTRRRLLSAAAVAGLAHPAVAAPVPRPAPKAAPLPREPGLHHHAMARQRFFGSAIDNSVLRHDKLDMAQVPVECGIVTSESAFKWSDIRPGPNTFNFAHADLIMSYAARHNMQVRGHTLLWHEGNPAWLADRISPTTAEAILRTHITTVCRRYRHRLTHWDVVNEALWPADNQRLGLRNSLWFKALGPRMLDIAFHACAEADPGALRFINDFGMDYAWPDNEAKRQAMLTLLSDLKARGVPVQGLGMQAHLEAGVDDAISQRILAKFCEDVASLGLQVVITEMDVRDNRMPADTTVRDQGVARHAKLFLDAMLASPAVLGVLTWGLSDRRTWLNDDLPRKDGLPQRPLPLDTELNRKALWHAMAESFDAAPARV